MEKKTKAIYFAELKDIVTAAVEDEETKNSYLDFIDKQLEALNKRREAAVKRAEKKKAESDALTEEIYAILSEDKDTTVDEIVVTFNTEEITRNKVTARLGKLVKAGLVAKTYVKVDGKKRTAYRKANEEAIEEAIEEANEDAIEEVDED